MDRIISGKITYRETEGDVDEATLDATGARVGFPVRLSDHPGSTVTIALAAGASNTMTITATVKDVFGATVAAVHNLEIWMSEAATGIGLTADAYSGDLTATAGAILSAHTAKKHWSVVTAATGVFTASLVDTAKPADQYVTVRKPGGGSVVVSAASGTSWGA